MATRVSAPRWRVLAAVAFLLAFLPAAPVAAQDRLCDPGGEDCRQILINHIRAEKVGLDVAFWFMEDSWIASEIINRWKAGVPVRVLVDTQANTPNPLNAHRLAELSAAGIPMRERVVGGILHWKMMLFEGQSLVQFSAANYSSDAWLYSGAPYTNYVDEVILFTSDAALVNSFRTRYDDLWLDTSYYADYANVTARARVYGTHPIDPRLNFVPWENHATRATALYAQEQTQIDVVMYRITDSRYADAMIAAVNRGVKVRLFTEPKQYRDPIRQYHSYNVDRMFMAGVEIRHRAHAGLNHQKSVLLHDLRTAVFGSSNWSSASSDSQEEHNLFTQDDWIYQWLTAQFDRKWNNTTGVAESAPFAPLAPDAPSTPAPAPQATGVATTATLQWYPGLWAHKYDVYLGTDPVSLPRVASDLPLGPSRYSGDVKSYAVSNLLPGTTYYWRIAGKTMANQEAASPVWSFTTAGVAPPKPVVTLVRGPYLQQVGATGAIVVWATKEQGSAQLRVTPPSGSSTTVAATSTLFPATATGLATDYYQHVAQVTGLSPSTVYAYDVLVSGVDVNSSYDTISTAPATGGGTVSFVAFGDSGIGSAEQQQVATLLAQDVFDLALHGGDLAYGTAQTTGAATHQTMDDWFFAPYAGWMRSRPFYPSIGNHDSRAANADGRPYLDLFVLPTHGAASGYPDHAERYYSFDYGPLHVIVLDTELAFQDPARQAAQLAWADADLASTTQPWKVALYHRSPYSAGGEHGSDLAVRQAFGPLFDKHGGPALDLGARTRLRAQPRHEGRRSGCVRHGLRGHGRRGCAAVSGLDRHLDRTLRIGLSLRARHGDGLQPAARRDRPRRPVVRRRDAPALPAAPGCRPSAGGDHHAVRERHGQGQPTGRRLRERRRRRDERGTVRGRSARCDRPSAAVLVRLGHDDGRQRRARAHGACV